MLEAAVAHLLQNVLPSADDYREAEQALTTAFNADRSGWQDAAAHVRRRGAELAIALDGMPERCAELGGRKEVLCLVAPFCLWPGSGGDRPGCLDRIRAVANVYKHHVVRDPSLPARSDDDVLVVGLGYGRDGWGVGKRGRPELLVCDRGTAKRYKFVGDAFVAICGWWRLLEASGCQVSAEPRMTLGRFLSPQIVG